jgi:hypothetical protein
MGCLKLIEKPVFRIILCQYDPVICRWLVPDPMAQHYSLYEAMSNNPIRFTDPDGGQTNNAAPNPKPCSNCGVSQTGNSYSTTQNRNNTNNNSNFVNIQNALNNKNAEIVQKNIQEQFNKAQEGPSKQDIAIKYTGAVSQGVSTVYDIRNLNGIAPVTKTGKALSKSTPMLGTAITFIDNGKDILDFSKNNNTSIVNSIQTTNLMDLEMVGFIAGVTMSSPPAGISIAVGYSIYQIVDLHSNKKYSNYINTYFPIDGN